MMKNKILIKVYIPNLDETYEIFIPTNERIKKILELIVKVVEEHSDSDFSSEQRHLLVDTDTLNIYSGSLIVRDTNLKNSKIVILI